MSNAVVARYAGRLVWPLALLAVALVAFAVNVFNGYHPTDDGLIFSWSWRIFNGEVPYRDFIYIRTPLTLYLHTVWLWLPDGWQIPAGRLAYYLEMVGVVALPLAWALRTGRLRTEPRSIGLVAIGLAFALHNFPPMPWYTVDGLLFGSAALTALLYSNGDPTRSALGWRTAASVAATLAALCKQNFAVLPALLLAFAVVEYARCRERPRPARLLASVLPGAAIVAVYATYLAVVGALPAAIGQLTTTVPPGEPLFSAAFVYVRFPVIVALAVLVPAGFIFAWSAHVRRPGPRGFALVRRASLPAVLGAVVLVQLSAVLLEVTGWGAYRLGHPVFWGLVGVAAALTALRSRGPAGDAQLPLLHWGVLALAWAGSISGGYASPILGLAPLGILLSQALPPERIRWERQMVSMSVALVMALSLFLNLQYPYRDRPRGEQVADLGDIYPRFGRLFTNEANRERFAELRQLTDRHGLSQGRPFAVLPTYALIYFLSGTRNPVSVNTYSYIEYRGFEAQLEREFDERRPVVLIERDTPTPVGARAEARVRCGEWSRTTQPGIVGHVAETWRLVAEGRFFCAYEHP